MTLLPCAFFCGLKSKIAMMIAGTAMPMMSTMRSASDVLGMMSPFSGDGAGLLFKSLSRSA